MEQSFHLPRSLSRERVIERVARVLSGLTRDKAWKVEITEHKPTRSHSQNSLLWSIYTEILRKGGETMAGWEKEDLHEFFLIQHFGSEIQEMFGRKKHKPLRRSSRLNKQEFADFVDHIVRFMADQGVFIEMPDDVMEVA